MWLWIFLVGMAVVYLIGVLALIEIVERKRVEQEKRRLVRRRAPKTNTK